jgi:hypothetical protein
LDFRFWIEELAKQPIQNPKSKIQNWVICFLCAAYGSGSGDRIF